jgi:hypothetical protein
VAQHDYSLSNQSGLSFRQDLNNALAAIVSQNSGATEPSTTYAYQIWLDTANGLVKQRNASNNGWVTVGVLGATNWGLATTASPTFSGTATFGGNVELTGTGYLDLPAGTTAQRPGSPTSGMIRFNSDLGQFEGYNGTLWSSVGGGATGGGSDQVFLLNDQAVTTSYTLASGKNAISAGPVTINAGVTVTVNSDQSWVIV